MRSKTTNKTKKKKKKGSWENKEGGKISQMCWLPVKLNKIGSEPYPGVFRKSVSISKSRSDLKAHPINKYLAVFYWKSQGVVISIMKYDCYIITSCLLVINFHSSRRSNDNYKSRAAVECKIWRIEESINSHTLVACLGESPVQWWEQ